MTKQKTGSETKQDKAPNQPKESAKSISTENKETRSGK